MWHMWQPFSLAGSSRLLMSYFGRKIVLPRVGLRCLALARGILYCDYGGTLIHSSSMHLQRLLKGVEAKPLLILLGLSFDKRRLSD